MDSQASEALKELESIIYNFIDLILSYAIPILMYSFLIVVFITVIQLLNNIITPINKEKENKNKS